MKKFRWSAILMIIAILGITGFQGYWLKNNYDREKQNLQITTNASFRQTILRQQAMKLKLDRFNEFTSADTGKDANVVIRSKEEAKRTFTHLARQKEPVITLLNLIQEKVKDSFPANIDLHFGPRGEFHNNMERMHPDSATTENGPVAISTLMDSLLNDPNRIQNVNIENGKNSSDKIITISVKKDFLYKMRPPYAAVRDSIGRLVKDNLPPPTRENGFFQKDKMPGDSRVFRFLYDIDSLSASDSVTVKDLTEAYATRLKEDRIDIPFRIERLDSSRIGLPNTVTIGFSKPATFGLFFPNTFGYMLGKLKLPILFSLLLVGITIISFVLLYRNIIRQQRLGELKNEFISNITHELKTPIATVGVAIEALKNFNAIDDAARTKEYLDISQNELQRLNMLVDKVLKLSVFEKQEIELKKEWFDCRQLTAEVMNSMRLQFEKQHAQVSLDTEGANFMVEADKLHITSVIYNLLDNALKYSKENPVIKVMLKSKKQHIELSVEDNGIGIPPEYKSKVFDKFFRVPAGDKHNAKGYGLGLSYVSEVLKRHMGFITVESELGRGSIFTAYIPYKELPVIQFDEHRKVFTKTIKIG